MNHLFKQKMQAWLGLPAKKRENVNKLFSIIASKYQFATRALSLGRDTVWKKMLINNLPADSSLHCVDIACGPGDLCFLLADRYSKGEITGIDFNQNMLTIARHNNPYPNIDFVEADMCDLQMIPSDSIDVVTGGYALRNAPDLEKFLLEVARILKKGGVVSFLEFSKPPSQIKQKIQFVILKTWGSFWGILLHRQYEVYAYLAESLKAFPDHQDLNKKLASAGFESVQRQPLFFGMLNIINCKKLQ